VLPVALVASLGALALLPHQELTLAIIAFIVGAAALTAMGFADDVLHIAPWPRLIGQLAIAVLVVAFIPDTLRLVHDISILFERLALAVALVWFINAWNFMDGADLMSVSGSIPLLGAVVVLWTVDAVSFAVATPAALLAASLLGFVPWNWAPARLFLGDAGSLPLGLAAGWFAVMLAAHGFLLAAVLLPVFHMSDASLTLLHRIRHRRPLFAAHRDHYYQQALDGGLSFRVVAGTIATLNVFLATLAVVASLHRDPVVNVAALVIGGVSTGMVLLWFGSRSR